MPKHKLEGTELELYNRFMDDIKENNKKIMCHNIWYNLWCSIYYKLYWKIDGGNKEKRKIYKFRKLQTPYEKGFVE